MKRFTILLLFLALSFNLYSQDNPFTEAIGNYSGTLPGAVMYNAVFGDYLYLLGDNKINIYNLSQPENPSFVKSTDHSNSQRIFAGGSNLLAVYNGDKITLYDISDPENPAKKSDYKAGADIVDVKFNGDYMYVLYMYEYTYNKAGSFEIVDVSNPALPVLKDTFKPNNIDGHAFCLSPDSTKAFTAHYDYAAKKTVLSELDISDPANITELKSEKFSNMTVKIELTDSYLFLLQTGQFAPPSYLRAIEISEEGDWINHNAVQVSTSRAQDMHVHNSSLTLTLWKGGIKDYLFSTETNSFSEGGSADFDRSSQFARYATTSSDGPGNQNSLGKTTAEEWDVFYYYVMNNQGVFDGMSVTYQGDKLFLARKWFRKNVEGDVFLTMGLEPMEAQAGGCSITPGVGTHTYQKDSNAEISATDNTSGGWVFDKWTGSVSSTSPSVSVTMDDDKSAIANFNELKLVVNGSKTETVCLCEAEDREVNIVTFKARAFGDNWIMSGISLTASGNGNDEYHLRSIRIREGNNILWEGTTFQEDDGKLTAAFNNTILIAEGQTRTFTINYYYKPEEINTSTEALSFHVNGKAIAKPQNHDTAPIIGAANGQMKFGKIYNSSQEMFMQISAAISDSSTKNGDEVILCPENFEVANILNVNKELTIKTKPGSNQAIIKQNKGFSDFPLFSIKSDNVTIKDLQIKNSYNGVSGYKQKNLTIDNVYFEEIKKQCIYLNAMNGTDISNSKFVSSSDIITPIIELISPKNTDINNNEFSDIGFCIQVIGRDMENTSINFNKFNVFSRGIGLLFSKGCDISYNEFKNLQDNAIELSSSEGNRIYSNTISNSAQLNEIDAIIVTGSTGSKIQKNKIYDCFRGVFEKESEGTKIENNKIYNTDFPIVLIGSSSFQIKSNYASNGFTGFSFYNSNNFNLINNKMTKFEKSYEGAYGFGILIEDSCSNGYVYSNILLANCTGIKIDKNNKNIKLRFNNINDSFCSTTGLNIDEGSEIDVSGNSFTNNSGAAILSSVSSGVTVSSNNFIGNEVALINNDNNSNLVADNNYWNGGAPSASDIQGNITVGNWLSEPVSLQTAFQQPELFAAKGKTDTLLLVVQNISDLFDEVEVTFSDDNNWLEGELTQTGIMADSSGLAFPLPYTVPNGENAGTVNRVYASVVSTKTDGLTDADTLLLTTYDAIVESIILNQDSSTVMQGESFQFTYSSLDEKENPINFTPQWSTDKGTISSEGLLETNGIEGEVTVTVTDPGSGKSANAKCFVATEEEKLKGIILTPKEISLDFGDSYLFSATAYNQFDFKMDMPLIWSASSGSITGDGFYIADGNETSVTITVSDSNQTVSAAAVISIENIVTNVEENKNNLPDSFQLSQNYPNPFNPVTIISYSLPLIVPSPARRDKLVEGRHVKLIIYDILGNEVATLVDRQQVPGNYEVTFNASNYSSGIYIYKLSSGSFSESKKMLLLK